MEAPEDRIQLVRYLNHHAPILFLLLDDTGVIRHANRFTCHFIGRPVIGKPFQDLILDFHHTFRLDQALSCPDTTHLMSFDTPSGPSQTGRFHFYTSGDHVLALGHLDVEEIASLSDELVAANQELNNLTRELNAKNRELVRANEKILELTRIDPLTGLANRRFFSETRTRTEDLVARFGGEEFIIAMPLADVHEAFAYAERIRCALSEQDILENGQPVTASFGVAGLFSGETGENAIKRADTALYQAKESGRNRTVVAIDPSSASA
jgi:GGDEF domain-containing protein